MSKGEQFTPGAVNLTAPSQVRALLDRHGLRPSRRLGQHFLIDANVLAKVVAAGELAPDDAVLEIGPGLGTLTRELARRAGRVVAVELDRSLLPVLEETLAGFDNVTVVHGDAARVDLAVLCGGAAGAPAGVAGDGVETRAGPAGAAEAALPAAASGPAVAGAGSRWKVVANLPYHVTGPVVARLLESGRFALAVVMVQLEVARRMVAAPGSREYGAFSVLVQYYAEPEWVARVPATAFLPPPEVGSAVVRLRVRAAPPVAADPQVFFAVVRAAFGQRRKSLRNALQSGLGGVAGAAERLLRDAGIDGERRGETLSLAEFARLAQALSAVTDIGRTSPGGRGRAAGVNLVK